mmetsp:Transcript_35132/g.67140  ORF Transcript_35132/g.67140 Transcript_35132/m.67140 type:complete len:206 (-) Transcript_35132:1271-1888(-)
MDFTLSASKSFFKFSFLFNSSSCATLLFPDKMISSLRSTSTMKSRRSRRSSSPDLALRSSAMRNFLRILSSWFRMTRFEASRDDAISSQRSWRCFSTSSSKVYASARDGLVSSRNKCMPFLGHSKRPWPVRNKLTQCRTPSAPPVRIISSDRNTMLAMPPFIVGCSMQRFTCRMSLAMYTTRHPSFAPVAKYFMSGEKHIRCPGF